MSREVLTIRVNVDLGLLGRSDGRPVAHKQYDSRPFTSKLLDSTSESIRFNIDPKLPRRSDRRWASHAQSDSRPFTSNVIDSTSESMRLLPNPSTYISQTTSQTVRDCWLRELNTWSDRAKRIFLVR